MRFRGAKTLFSPGFEKQVTARKKPDGTASILKSRKPIKIKEIRSNKEVEEPGSVAA
jgi:hypothetical protein